MGWDFIKSVIEEIAKDDKLTAEKLDEIFEEEMKEMILIKIINFDNDNLELSFYI